MAFAYVDHSGADVLHIVDDEATAKEYAKNGKYVETDVPHRGGYPYVVGEDGLVHDIIEEEGQTFIDGNIKNGRRIPTPEFVQSILDQLK